MEKYVVLVAGGKGLRMGGEVPKQFLPIGGKPVLMRTVEAFRDTIPDIHIVLVLPALQQAYWKELCQQYEFDMPVQMAEGGATRFDSVKNGLSKIPSDVSGLVAIHDGVRPFVSSDTIHRCFDEAEKSGAAIPVVPVVETLRMLLPEGGSCTQDRDHYRLVQTPQTFRIDVLKEAYLQSYHPSFTDDASEVEQAGHPISLVEGNRENIKLTTPFDLIVAENLCKT